VNKKVKWGPFFDHSNRTLTYNVTPPSGGTGTKCFSGAASFDGASVPIGGGDTWKGEYFNNKTLSGSPVMVRDDGAGFIDFNWGAGSPSSTCGIGSDNFSVRWTRTVSFYPATYRFTVTSDDGFRLYIDGTLKLDKWFDQSAPTYTVDVPLTAGGHTLMMEYYENGGVAVAKLSWEKVSTDSDCIATVSSDSCIEKCVCTPHPADTNSNYLMAINEVTAYSSAWITGQTWPTPPNPIPIEYVTNAGYLWRMGEVYHCDLTKTPPWVPGPAPAGEVQKDSIVSEQGPVLLGMGSVIRDLADTYTPSVPMSVSISVSPNSATLVYAVEDTPPVGWVVSNINESGQWDSVNKKVKWGPFFDSNIRTLTYQATPPAGESGTKAFSGTVSFDGNNVSIGGN
jgi:hypothetical protein